MSKSTAGYLQDLIQEIDDIIAFTQEGEAAFMQDVKTQKAVIRSYEVIGEISKRLPSDFRTANTQIDWRKLITFRDFLAHNYEFIGLRYVWDAVQDAPNLRATIESFITALTNDKEADET